MWFIFFSFLVLGSYSALPVQDSGSTIINFVEENISTEQVTEFFLPVINITAENSTDLTLLNNISDINVISDNGSDLPVTNVIADSCSDVCCDNGGTTVVNEELRTANCSGIIIPTHETSQTNRSDNSLEVSCFCAPNEVPLVKKYTRDENKILRVHGKKYQGLKRDGSTKTVTEREERKMLLTTCSHQEGRSSKRSFMCSQITENARKKVYEHFWALNSWGEKKSHINGLVDFRKVLRRRKETNNERAVKLYGYDCYLPRDDGIKVRVCRNFFLSTTGLKRSLFNTWIKEFNTTIPQCGTATDDEMNEQTGGKAENEIAEGPKTTKKKLKSDTVLIWLELIPKVPSHYCRASTSRIYVEPEFRSLNHMHEIYKEWCNESGNSCVERKKFCEILDSKKISIFKPRKDQCDTCVSFKEGNIEERDYAMHIKKKEDARRAKDTAVSSASETTLVVTMDVQSVLLCPKLLISKQYYCQKLQVHNFTFYVNNNRDVHLYVWHEGEGRVTANEFTSCIVHFIKQNPNYSKIILISDGCPYQNKNRILASALADFSAKLETEIEQIILEKGHTMMEVDSVHSTLERLFTPPIYTPAHYVSKMEAARNNKKNAHPYIINHIDHTFFKNYEELPSNYASIRPGKKLGDPTVADIRALLYKEGNVFYRLSHSEDWQPLPQRRKMFRMPPKPLYSDSLKIEKGKFHSLQGLKPFMHKEYHLFYDSLKHE